MSCLLKREYLSEDEAREVIAPLVDAITYCHKLGTIHRDIKLENILLTTNDLKTAIIKLTDFSFSTYADKEIDRRTCCGT